MNLVLAPRNRLVAIYGSDFSAIDAALQAAITARTAAGYQTQRYDPEAGMPELGVAPTTLEPTAIITQLQALSAAYARQGGIINSLWIIGGPQVTPFATLPNPMADSDGPLPVDSPYGLASTAEPLMRWPVGRTPDAVPHEPGLLVRLLERVAAAHRAGPQPAAPVVTLGAERWAAPTAAVYAAADLEGALYTAPPFRSGPAATAALREARLLYANLHGIRADSTWYGQGQQQTALTPALDPTDPPQLAGTLIISQACYGARLDDPRADRSLAIAFLAAGADALIATHVLAYGAPDLPLGESDLLAVELLQAVRTPGVSIGAAILTAHSALLRMLLRRQGSLAANDIKTLVSFGLYGDPTLRWCA